MEIKHSKKLYGIVVALVMILIVLIAVTAQTSYTYSSKATEKSDTVTIAAISQESIMLPSENYPECVQFLSYLPSTGNTQESCYVQFECQNADAVQSVQLATNHCMAEKAQISCDLTTGCHLLNEWVQYARTTCGC